MGGSGYSGVVAPGPRPAPLSSTDGSCLTCPKLWALQSGILPVPALRTVPAAYLAGTRCHLVAVVGLSVPGKQVWFFFNQVAAQQLHL